jgi:hypothetical protein
MLVGYMQVTVQEYLQSSVVVVQVAVRYESQFVEKPYFKARESGQSKQAPRLKTKRRAASSANHMPKTRFFIR